LSTSLASSSGSVAHDLDQQARRFGVDAHPALPELLRDPVGHAPLRHVIDEQIADLRTGLGQRGVLLELRGDECEHGVGRGARKVRSDRLRVGGLPAVDVLDDHEPPASAEQAERVARRDRVVAARLVRGEKLRRVLADAIAQPSQRALDLRAIGARDQVDGLELGRCHPGQA
jgi:hypothetical protein